MWEFTTSLFVYSMWCVLIYYQVFVQYLYIRTCNVHMCVLRAPHGVPVCMYLCFLSVSVCSVYIRMSDTHICTPMQNVRVEWRYISTLLDSSVHHVACPVMRVNSVLVFISTFTGSNCRGVLLSWILSLCCKWIRLPRLYICTVPVQVIVCLQGLVFYFRHVCLSVFVREE
jgi:hypothetical protein